jgi:hypothetical protein
MFQLRVWMLMLMKKLKNRVLLQESLNVEGVTCTGLYEKNYFTPISDVNCDNPNNRSSRVMYYLLNVNCDAQLDVLYSKLLFSPENNA